MGRAGRREGEEFSVDVEGFDEVVVSVVIDDVRGDSESGGVDIVDDEALGPVDVEDRFRIWCSLYFGKCHTPLSFLSLPLPLMPLLQLTLAAYGSSSKISH